jgi:hypothetical protein
MTSNQDRAGLPVIATVARLGSDPRDDTGPVTPSRRGGRSRGVASQANSQGQPESEGCLRLDGQAGRGNAAA